MPRSNPWRTEGRCQGKEGRTGQEFAIGALLPDSSGCEGDCQLTSCLKAMDAAPAGNRCAPKWKAAREDSQKVKYGYFDETGWFPLVCRHGVVWAYSDMIQSGELSIHTFEPCGYIWLTPHSTKYPLSAVLWALKHFPKKMAIGYDIGCVFGGTVERAPISSDLAKQQELFVCACASR